MKTVQAALTVSRPLSNVKNAAMILLASLLSGITPPATMLAAFLHLSCICSAAYVFNALSDVQADASSKTKRSYALAALRLGPARMRAMIAVITLGAGLCIPFIGLRSAFFGLLLWLNMMLYSHPKLRLKDKPVFDIMSGAALTYPLRFLTAWYALTPAGAPMGVVAVLTLAKISGFLMYKEQDRSDFLSRDVRNSITVLSPTVVRSLSVASACLGAGFFIILCLYRGPWSQTLGILPTKSLFAATFVVPPLIAVMFQKKGMIGKITPRTLRQIGLAYFAVVAAILWTALTWSA